MHLETLLGGGTHGGYIHEYLASPRVLLRHYSNRGGWSARGREVVVVVVVVV